MRRRGLSLVEVIVALALLACVMLFVLNLFPTALTTVHQLEKEEEINSRAHSLLELYSCETWPVGTVRNLPAFEVQGIPISGELRVEAQPDSDPKMLVRLHLTLNWKDRGRPHQLVRESLVQRLKR